MAGMHSGLSTHSKSRRGRLELLLKTVRPSQRFKIHPFVTVCSIHPCKKEAAACNTPHDITLPERHESSRQCGKKNLNRSTCSLFRRPSANCPSAMFSLKSCEMKSAGRAQLEAVCPAALSPLRFLPKLPRCSIHRAVCRQRLWIQSQITQITPLSVS